MQICWKIVVLRHISQRAREHRQAFFLKVNLSYKLQLLNVQRNFCSVMCYTVLIWTLTDFRIWLHLFSWLKPVHYIPNDKINATICIRIRIQRSLEVKICIRWMRIFLTSFVTSLNDINSSLSSPVHISDFTHIISFENHNTTKWLRLQIEARSFYHL